MPLSTQAARPKPYRKTLCYGVHGVGKNHFAWGVERGNPVFIRTEDGTSDVEHEGKGIEHEFPVCQTLEEVESQVRELMTEDHDRRRLVIDSADWLEPMLMLRAFRLNPVKNKPAHETVLSDYDFGKGYELVAKEWKNLFNMLDALAKQRQMTILFLAHCKTEEVTPPDAEPFERYAPKISKRASALLQEWCDEVLFAQHESYTVKTDAGFNRDHIRGKSTGRRVLRTTETAAWMAKNRLNLPAELEMTPENGFGWDAYADFWEPKQ